MSEEVKIYNKWTIFGGVPDGRKYEIGDKESENEWRTLLVTFCKRIFGVSQKKKIMILPIGTMR